MEMRFICPTCGTPHLKQVPFSWTVDENRIRKLEIVCTSQSANRDSGPMEGLIPFFEDGQHLCIEGDRLDDRQIRFLIWREPAKTAGGIAEPEKTVSRVDMETDAAECGLKVNPKWNDVQMAKALKDHKIANDPKKLHASIMSK